MFMRTAINNKLWHKHLWLGENALKVYKSLRDSGLSVIAVSSSGMKMQLRQQCLLRILGAVYCEGPLNDIYTDHIFEKGMW